MKNKKIKNKRALKRAKEANTYPEHRKPKRKEQFGLWFEEFSCVLKSNPRREK